MRRRRRLSIAYSDRLRWKRWMQAFGATPTGRLAKMRACARLANLFDFIAGMFVA
jgi:hypothetical protein